MKAIFTAIVSITAVGMVLVGCTSTSGIASNPQLTIEKYRADGIYQETFGVGEKPVLVALGLRVPKATMRVTRTPDGIVVLQHEVSLSPQMIEAASNEGRSGFVLPELGVGEFTADLLVRDEVIDRVKFSITGKPATPTYETTHARGVAYMDLNTDLKAFVSGCLRRCPAIALRVGAVTDVKSLRNEGKASPQDSKTMLGHGTYQVEGAIRSETFTIYWEKQKMPGRLVSYKVVRVETAGGEILPLD